MTSTWARIKAAVGGTGGPAASTSSAEPAPNPDATIVSHDPKADFWSRAQPIERRHLAQTEATVAKLRAKYEAPIVGDVRVWDQVLRLAACIDPTDSQLYNTSQLVHVLQVIEGMAHDGIVDDDMVLAALVHDIGKVLLLTDEDPANVVCTNTVVAAPGPGAGLDACTFQWNHDEFAWSRLGAHLPDHVAWLVRYHSIDIAAAEPYFDDRDRDYADRYLRVFARYDHGTKSAHLRPSISIESYRELVEATFPDPIPF
ncbi:MAG: inositol oxygenase family protein [Acidimicrobiales bacterium]